MDRVCGSKRVASRVDFRERVRMKTKIWIEKMVEYYKGGLKSFSTSVFKISLNHGQEKCLINDKMTTEKALKAFTSELKGVLMKKLYKELQLIKCEHFKRALERLKSFRFERESFLITF